MLIDKSTLSITTAPNGLLVTQDMVMQDQQRILVSMVVPLASTVPLVRLQIAAVESALQVLQGNLERLRKQLPPDQPSLSADS